MYRSVTQQYIEKIDNILMIHYICFYISLEEITLDSKNSVENETKQGLEASLEATVWITSKKCIVQRNRRNLTLVICNHSTQETKTIRTL